jgi:hypothetical protein
VRRLLIGVLALGACALAPATASAAPSLTAGPVPYKSYQLSFTLSKSGAKYNLGVMMNRSAAGGKSTQLHMWSFPLSAKAVKLTAKGATIKTGKELGRYGSINMTIAAGKPKSTVLPCFVKAFTQRKGTLAGKLRLTLDGGYFKKVSKSTLPAGITATLPAVKPNCGTGGGNGGGQNAGSLRLFGMEPDGVMFTATRDAKGTVNHSAFISETGTTIAPASSIMHMINATAPAAGLEAAADNSTATLAFASPFLAGNLAFTSMEGMNSPQSAMGDLAGSLQIKFDSPGARTITALANASLQRS